MAKDPAILFYPADWLMDAVSGCSIGAQGLWWRMLIAMHSSERRGYLMLNGRPMPDAFIATKCGLDVQTYRTLLQELDDAGVPSRTAEGTIYNRRMVRDEEGRAKERKKKQDQRQRSSVVPALVPPDVPVFVPPLSDNENVSDLEIGSKPPENLHPVAYARGILERLDIPVTNHNCNVVAAAVKAKGKNTPSLYPAAVEHIIARAMDDRDEGVEITTFWFSEGRYERRKGKSSPIDREPGVVGQIPICAWCKGPEPCHKPDCLQKTTAMRAKHAHA